MRGRAYLHQIGLSHSDISKSKQLFNLVSPKKWNWKLVDLDRPEVLRKIVKRRKAHSVLGWPLCHRKSDSNLEKCFLRVWGSRFLVRTWASMTALSALLLMLLPGLEPEVLSGLTQRSPYREFLLSSMRNYDQVPQGVAYYFFSKKWL